jgi:hypothetical protein
MRCDDDLAPRIAGNLRGTADELRVVVASPAVERAMQVLGADQMLRLHPNMTCALTGAPDSHCQSA